MSSKTQKNNTHNLKKRNSFQFKEFSIDAKEAGMPVSTDGVLLGAWIEKPTAQLLDTIPSLLDLGCGTGLLTLMCAQRFPDIQITAIDIDANAIKAAKYNIENSRWHNRINVIEADVLATSSLSVYDSIICNPPYFNQGQPAQNNQRALARHTMALSHENLLKRSFELLTTMGKAHFILPTTEGDQFIEQAQATGWFLARCCQVRSFAHKAPNRLLITLQKIAIPQISTEKNILKSQTNSFNQPLVAKPFPEYSQLTIYQANHDGKPRYSSDFIELTKTFYLKMP